MYETLLPEGLSSKPMRCICIAGDVSILFIFREAGKDLVYSIFEKIYNINVKIFNDNWSLICS